MPEGPEVKTVAKTLSDEIVGVVLKKLWRSEYQLRAPVLLEDLQKLEGTTIDTVECHGKMLFLTSKGQTILLAQLGMTGQLVVAKHNDPLKPHTHLRWQLSSGKELRYVDPRRFGLIAPCDNEHRAKLMTKLGPDPFTMTKASMPDLVAAIRRSARAIKEVILDQSVIVGVGNIYASEALFLAGIHPEQKASEVSEEKILHLIEAIVRILNEAFKNSGTTFSNYVDGTGKKGKNQAFLQVFQREGQPCVRCSKAIVRIKQGGRSTFYCVQCQGDDGG